MHCCNLQHYVLKSGVTWGWLVSYVVYDDEHNPILLLDLRNLLPWTAHSATIFWS